MLQSKSRAIYVRGARTDFLRAQFRFLSREVERYKGRQTKERSYCSWDYLCGRVGIPRSCYYSYARHPATVCYTTSFIIVLSHAQTRRVYPHPSPPPPPPSPLSRGEHPTRALEAQAASRRAGDPLPRQPIEREQSHTPQSPRSRTFREGEAQTTHRRSPNTQASPRRPRHAESLPAKVSPPAGPV